MTNEKRVYLERLRQTLTGLAGLKHVLDDLETVYNARLYGPGGAGEITGTELAEFELTQNDLQLAIFLCHNMTAFLKGQVPEVSDYTAILNSIRTDI